jgi:hypothetical protein
VARAIKEIIVSRWIGGTEKHGRLRVIVRCKHERMVLVKIVYVVVVVCFLLLHTTYARNKRACVIPQNVTLWKMA